MQTLTEKTVRDIAAENPASVAVFESLGIDYCCGGGKPLTEACAHARVDVARVLALMEEAARLSQPGEQKSDWARQPLCGLIAHIVDKHHAFVRQATVRISTLLRKVASHHGPDHPELHEIGRLFEAMGQELSTHMLKEEHILFPYIERLEQGGPRPQSCFGTVRHPIANMIAEHDDAGALLQRIRELARGYALPAGACASYQALYRELQDFERDLHQHVHLENNILFPRAVALEDSH